MWIIPSVCGRAELVTLMRASRATAMTAPIAVLFDIRDSAASLMPPPNWRLIPSMGRLEAADCVRIAQSACPAGGAVGFLPADHVPLTPGWDVALEHAAGGWNIAYGDDLLTAGRHPVGGADRVSGAVCIGGALAREIGTPVPQGMSFADARIAWAALGRALGALVYLKSVQVEWRPQPKSDSRGTEPLFGDERRARLFRWLNDELRPLARRVREARALAALEHADEARAV